MIERAGFWRRGVAAVVDLIVTQIALQALVAVAFAVTGGHVTANGSLYNSCQTAKVAPSQIDLPSGVVLPRGFVPNEQGTCRSSFFGATTRLVFVVSRAEQHGTTTTRLTRAYPVGPDGRTAWSVFDADFLRLPLFVLLRWLADRYAGGSLGRRLARIAVTDGAAAATGAGLAQGLARRYARFAWPLLPGAVVGCFASAYGAAIGPVPQLVSILIWGFGPTLSSAAWLVAARQILGRADTYYDAPVGTVVTPRIEIERSEAPPTQIGAARLVAEAVAALDAGWRARPRLALTLLALMAVVYALEASRPGGASLETLAAFGGMDQELVVLQGQIYRMATAVLIHGSLAHLAANGFALLVAGWLIEDLLGRVLFLGVFVGGGLAASIASVSFNAPQLLGIGASGAIQALLTTALIISVRLPKGSRRAWTQALPIVIGVPALIPVVQLPGALSIDRADHVGGTIAGVLMGLAIAFAWRDGVIRRPGRRTALAFGGIAAATLLLPIPFTGWQDPTLIAHLVPPADLPTTEAAWRKRGGDLARLYPDDPRAVLGLATSEIRSGQTAAGLVDLDRAIALQQRLAPSASRSFRFQAHAEVGGELFNAGKLDETITQYGLALADNPSAEIFRNRGIAEFLRSQAPRCPGGPQASESDRSDGGLLGAVAIDRGGPQRTTRSHRVRCWRGEARLAGQDRGLLRRKARCRNGGRLGCDARPRERPAPRLRGQVLSRRAPHHAGIERRSPAADPGDGRHLPARLHRISCRARGIGGGGRISNELRRLGRPSRFASSPPAPARAARRSASARPLPRHASRSSRCRPVGLGPRLRPCGSNPRRRRAR